MAAIDKTYTKSYKNYKSLIEWAKDITFTCPNGMKLKPINDVYKCWKEEDFNTELPVMNTGHSMDYFLIKYCPLKFVQNRMKEVYDEEFYESVKKGTSEYDTFSKEGKYGVKCKCIKRPDITTNRPWGQKEWFVQLNEPNEYNFLWYNEKYDNWVWPYELGYSHGNTCWKFKTIKSLIRHIRKWKLPKGTIVRATSRYVGIDWEFKVY